MKSQWPLLLLALCAALPGCVNREAQAQAKRTEELLADKTIAVTVADVTRRTIADDLEISGTITTGDDTQVGAKVPGRLTAVFVKDGDEVAAGQTIAQQETSDLLAQVRSAQANVDAQRALLARARTDAAVGPTRSENAVQLAEDRLAQAKAQLQKVLNGARIEERRQAEAQVDAARSGMETARLSLERGKGLYEEGALSKAELDQRQNAFNAAQAQYTTALEALSLIQKGARDEDIRTAEAEVRAAEKGLADAKAQQRLDVQYQRGIETADANLRAAQQQLSLAQQALADATIRAPFSGRISGRPLQVGTYIAPGTPIARLVSAGGVYFEGQVPETSINRVQPGTPVQVKVGALDQTYSGVITAVNPLGNDIARLFSVRVNLGPEASGVLPGMFARGIVQVGESQDATLVPTTALQGTGERRTLYIVGADNTAKRLEVRVGLSTDGLTEVYGVDPSAKVIVRGATSLTDGAKIQIDVAENTTDEQGA